MPLGYLDDTPPLEELEEVELEIDDKTTIKIFTNLGGYLDPAVMNWLARTTEQTAESFSLYIKSKRDKGYSEHWVLTEEQYAQALLDDKIKRQ
jgi:hypothetical protein